MSSFSVVQASIGSPLRGPGSTPQPGGHPIETPIQFFLQSMDITEAWGAQPATGVATYVREMVSNETVRTNGVAIGSYMELIMPGHHFYGICKSDTFVDSSSGQVRTLEFEDLRMFLQWDYVFGEFNRIESEKTIVNGRTVLRRRFRHVLPDTRTGVLNFSLGKVTYTTAPLSAATILNLLFQSSSVATIWRCLYHVDQVNYPVYELDFSNGTRLDSALVQISEGHGLTFKLAAPWLLEWDRKGYLKEGQTFPVDITNNYVFPLTQNGQPATNDNRDGFALSGNPTRIIVLGDRNLYQVLNIDLEIDWARAWEQFAFIDDFVEYVIDTYEAPDTPGQTFRTRPVIHTEDPDNIIGTQMGRWFALRLTVRQFCATAGNQFADQRKFAGRSRMDMPAYLYIQQVLFHCFRPPTSITINGLARSLYSLKLEDRMLVAVTYDQGTGLMEFDVDQPIEGNGFAIVPGYQVGQDAFAAVQPHRFNVGQWTADQDIYAQAPFHIDDSGEGNRFLVFESPIIRSDDLITIIDGHAVALANPVFHIPIPRASLTFSAERFYIQYVADPNQDPATAQGWRDQVINENGLYAEFVCDAMQPTVAATELVFADNKTARQKAIEIAATTLNTQWAFRQGGFKRYLFNGDIGTHLNPMYDRVTVRYDASGFYENVDFTTQRGTNAFQPVRSFERLTVSDTLFPGQGALKQEQRQLQLIAGGLRINPRLRRTLSDAFRGVLGDQPVVASSVHVREGSGTFLAGTALYAPKLKPSVDANQINRKTCAEMPATSTAVDHPIFKGAVLRQNERADHNVPIAVSGDILVLVQGEISAGDSVVRGPDGETYLVKAGSDEAGSGESTAPVLGTALQDVAAGQVQLILVRTGGGGAVTVTAGDAVWS